MSGKGGRRENPARAAGKTRTNWSRPPLRIEHLGDGAYWTSNQIGGALYVLKGDSFIRISIGGPEKAELKLAKSKALAEKALQRL